MPTIRIAAADPEDSDVAELLFAAIGGDRSRLTAVAHRYRDSKAASLIAATIGDALVGVAGYEVHREYTLLLHIATDESRRRCGIGRRLLTEIRSRHPHVAVIAETDRTSLGFYLATGFTATSLGEKYPGVERFRCCSRPDDFSATSSRAAASVHSTCDKARKIGVKPVNSGSTSPTTGRYGNAP